MLIIPWKKKKPKEISPSPESYKVYLYHWFRIDSFGFQKTPVTVYHQVLERGWLVNNSKNGVIRKSINIYITGCIGYRGFSREMFLYILKETFLRKHRAPVITVPETDRVPGDRIIPETTIIPETKKKKQNKIKSNTIHNRLFSTEYEVS